MAERDSTLRRICIIAGTDVRMRIARGSTVVVLVALCIFAYVLVPDLSTGRALMQVNGHRALYNSATIALATSSLCAVMLGLAGFYLTSNTVRRDVESRPGYVIASTRVRSSLTIASTSGRSSRISSPAVPFPAMNASSSKGWTK